MSLIPAGELSYAALVSEFFLQLRGTGLLLSPLDLELVAEWERRGVPASVVHALTPVAPVLGTHWSAVAAHTSLPLALAVMTLDYQRVHATVLLGQSTLP